MTPGTQTCLVTTQRSGTGGRGGAVGRDVKWEGTWVDLWLIHVAVW